MYWTDFKNLSFEGHIIWKFLFTNFNSKFELHFFQSRDAFPSDSSQPGPSRVQEREAAVQRRGQASNNVAPLNRNRRREREESSSPITIANLPSSGSESENDVDWNEEIDDPWTQ